LNTRVLERPAFETGGDGKMADAGGSVTAEAAAQAEGFKAEGNRLLAAKEMAQAVEMYSRAIDLDPDNAVFYSNRSAAYLAMGDARGKALRDAERCIELRPDWWKGYSRKGAAEHALLRFDAARATYNEGLKLDPDNASLAQAAEEAYAAGQAHSQRLREQAKEQERLEKQAEERREALEREKREAEAAKKDEPKDEDDLLAAFMSEVQEIEESANCIKKDAGEEEKKKEKLPVEFGTPEGQIERLLQPHFEWINLNPFRVLMLDTDATEEDMKQHYRKVCALCIDITDGDENAKVTLRTFKRADFGHDPSRQVPRSSRP
jgi:DnaJ family protein C protein 8